MALWKCHEKDWLDGLKWFVTNFQSLEVQPKNQMWRHRPTISLKRTLRPLKKHRNTGTSGFKSHPWFPIVDDIEFCCCWQVGGDQTLWPMNHSNRTKMKESCIMKRLFPSLTAQTSLGFFTSSDFVWDVFHCVFAQYFTSLCDRQSEKRF